MQSIYSEPSGLLAAPTCTTVFVFFVCEKAEWRTTSFEKSEQSAFNGTKLLLD